MPSSSPWLHIKTQLATVRDFTSNVLRNCAELQKLREVHLPPVEFHRTQLRKVRDFTCSALQNCEELKEFWKFASASLEIPLVPTHKCKRFHLQCCPKLWSNLGKFHLPPFEFCKAQPTNIRDFTYNVLQKCEDWKCIFLPLNSTKVMHEHQRFHFHVSVIIPKMIAVIVYDMKY